VLGTGWCGEEGAGPGVDDVVAVEELNLAREDVHRVDVIVVVESDLESGVELDLVDRELRQLDPDRDYSVLADEPLAIAGPTDDRSHPTSSFGFVMSCAESN
jgi:hypothetical protein